MASDPGSNQATEKTDNNDEGLSSTFRTTISLQDWWLIKAEKEFQGKQLAIAGLTSKKQRAVRVFSSAPIAKRYDTFTVETDDGVCIFLKGFINKQRTIENGFPFEVFSHFVFGFPPYWEECAAKFLEQDSVSDSESPIKCEHTIHEDRKEAEVSEDLSHEVSANIEIGVSKVSNAKGKIDQVNITTTSVRRSNRLSNSRLNYDEISNKCVEDELQQTSSVKRGRKFRSRKTQGCVQNVLTSRSDSSAVGFDKKNDNKYSTIAVGEEETYSKERSSSRKKPMRKLSFDTHVTPCRQKAQVKMSGVSPESSSFRRSRSGRVLLPTMEFWRNQMPIYDADHKLIGIKQAERLGGGGSEPNKKSRQKRG